MIYNRKRTEDVRGVLTFQAKKAKLKESLLKFKNSRAEKKENLKRSTA